MGSRSSLSACPVPSSCEENPIRVFEHYQLILAQNVTLSSLEENLRLNLKLDRTLLLCFASLCWSFVQRSWINLIWVWITETFDFTEFHFTEKSPPPEFPFIGWTLLFIADNDAEDGNNSLTGIDWGHLCTQRALFSGDCHNGARTKTCSSWAAQRLSGVCILRHPGPGKVLEHIKIFRKWLKSYKICTRRNHNHPWHPPSPALDQMARLDAGCWPRLVNFTFQNFSN